MESSVQQGNTTVHEEDGETSFGTDLLSRLLRTRSVRGQICERVRYRLCVQVYV